MDRSRDRDKAFLVGFSYPNRGKFALPRVADEVKLFRRCLVDQLGYPDHNVRTLLDTDADFDQSSVRARFVSRPLGRAQSASPKAMYQEEGIAWLLDGAQPGDRLVFYCE